MRRPNRDLNVFSMSALDLFASAMGAFIIVAIIMFPYYMNASQAESRVQEAKRQHDAAMKGLDQATMEAEREGARAEGAEADAKAAREAADDAAATRDRMAADKSRIESDLTGCETRKSSLEIKDLDLAFVVDTTASMGGQISALRDELVGIVQVLEKIVNELRIGVVAYRDIDMMPAPAGPDYETLGLPLTAIEGGGLSGILAFIGDLQPAGGRSCAEAVELGLDEAVGMTWRPKTRRHIVVIGDAEAHAENHHRAFSLAEAFAAAPIDSRVSAVYEAHPTTPCPDAARDAAFFSELARRGGGEFVDDGGTLTEAILMSVIGR